VGVLAATIGSRGESQPVTALAVQLKALGNDVEVVAPPDFEELVTGNGIAFTPVGPTLRNATAVKTTPDEPVARSWRPRPDGRAAAHVRPVLLGQPGRRAGAHGRSEGRGRTADGVVIRLMRAVTA
jgi:hypothetical protein